METQDNKICCLDIAILGKSQTHYILWEGRHKNLPYKPIDQIIAFAPRIITRMISKNGIQGRILINYLN